MSDEHGPDYTHRLEAAAAALMEYADSVVVITSDHRDGLTGFQWVHRGNSFACYGSVWEWIRRYESGEISPMVRDNGDEED